MHSLSNVYGFQRPNDARALNLMNDAARAVMAELPDVCFAYGMSDEYRLALHNYHAKIPLNDVKLRVLP